MDNYEIFYEDEERTGIKQFDDKQYKRAAV